MLKDIQAHAHTAWQKFTNPSRLRILLGDGTCGRAAGIEPVAAALSEELNKAKVSADFSSVGCLGMCYAEPLIEINSPGVPPVLYGKMTPALARSLVRRYLKHNRPDPSQALAIMEGAAQDGIPAFSELPMIRGQMRLVTGQCGRIDPLLLEHYIACGGFTGLDKAFAIGPEETVKVVTHSGLRGRGGAGFPTGLKWEFCRKAQGDQKYLICNADEGDPGAFMDRSLLEGDPYRLLEGMIIAAYAIGASQAYIYCRAEYPLAIERLHHSIQQLRTANLLGENILKSDFSLQIKVKEGAGAFVCGEETALMNSLAGQRGTPRPRPPFPAERGLFGKPSNINNVETLANIPEIIVRGADWYAGIGTEKSKGTKVFSLVGKVNRTGLIEVPMGMTLREIVFDIGGGIIKGKQIKAVQTGGPSGGCISAELLNLPVDYEKLDEAGSIMGSGGLVVMDEDTCMVDIARYFIEFTKNESCGKCVPCRLGTNQMHLLLEDICAGRVSSPDGASASGEVIKSLERIGESVKAASLCGLGQTAPNPVLSTLRYFRDEYEAHVLEHKCPAGSCAALITFSVDQEKCISCGACQKICPVEALTGPDKEPPTLNQETCTRCRACHNICPVDAIRIT